MQKKLDLVSIGEILIDFVGKEQSTALKDVTDFRRAAGGGPANVAVGAARLGMKTAFVGKIGSDAFGQHLQQILENSGVSIEGVVTDPAANTTLVFVALNQKGVPDFSFFRHGTADTLLRIDELPVNLLQDTKILHFSSVALSSEPSRSACLKAVEIARNAGALISFDPNLRMPLWPDAPSAKTEILAAAALADILKMNDDEYFFLTGHSIADGEIRNRMVWNDRVKLLAVTQGEKGSVLFSPQESMRFPVLPIRVVDTTGAGDAFMAGVIAVLAESAKTDPLDLACMERIGKWAGAAAALACQHSGGIPSLPHREAVAEFIASIQPQF